MKNLLTGLVLMLLTFNAYSQIIKGTILDKNTQKPIDYAQVYVAGSFAGTQTDKDGNFEFKAPRELLIPLTISALGYSSVNVPDYRSGKPLIVYLTPKVYELDEFVIKSDNIKKDKKERERYLMQFRDQFLGKTLNARYCKILNENDIELIGEENILKAFSNKPIVVENRALGYKITFFLDEFKYDMKKSIAWYKGNILFSEDLDQKSLGKFEKQRRSTYYGSKMHFFRSLWDDKLEKEHFIVRDSLKILSEDKFTGITRDSTGNSIKYLKYKGAVWVDYGQDFKGSRLDIEKDTVYFDRNGLSVAGVRWNGKMGKERIADILPVEYSPSGKDELNRVTPDNVLSAKRNSSSDRFTKYSPTSFAEKIYLQLDGKVYTTDKTIWFKAVVTNAVDHTPTSLSKILHVELIGPDERIIEKKLIKLEEGIGEGFFDLSQHYPEGAYQVRAYTQWDKNYGDDFFFKEYIRVFAPSAKAKAEPINKIVVTEKPGKGQHISACFDPLALDSLHKKELTVFLTLDNRKDSLLIKKGKDNRYALDYDLPVGCQFVTLDMQTSNSMGYSKTIALREDSLDLQFLPESGELVHGLPCKIGFKALDYNGKGKKVEGEIVDKNGEVITTFESNELGMGSFVLTRADSSARWYARVKTENGERRQENGEGGTEKGAESGEKSPGSQNSESPALYPIPHTLYPLFPLPKVAASGNILSVSRIRDEIRLQAASSYLKNDSILLRVTCRGKLCYEIRERLREGIRAFSLLSGGLPEGIIAFTLMDKESHPLAERLYFNERPETRIDIKVSPDKQSYSQREMTKLNIETADKEGKAVNASLSLLVINKDQLGKIQDKRQNILSYFLLSSELKGEIENPGYYFNGNKDRQNDLDALMLTQGWRKYNYTKSVDKILFQPETDLSVSGKVSGAVFQKLKKGAELTMATFGKNRTYIKTVTDSLGRFTFKMDDEYGQNLNVLIQSANQKGEKKEYTITLDRRESPAVSFNHVRSIEKPDSIIREIVAKNIERKNVEDARKLSSGTILLDEVLVEGTQMSPAKKLVTEEYGKPKVVISGKAIQDKEQKWSYGLFSVLMYNFPDQIEVKSFRGVLYARVKLPGMTFFVIDGTIVNHFDYPLIGNIPPSEVKSVDVIPHTKNFIKLFSETYPFASLWNLPAGLDGHVIAIYTHAGKGLLGAQQAKGMMKTTVPVFSASREFYAPKHDNPSAWVNPDLRSLVHWAPNLRVDSLGKASASFYNADNTGEMKVVVEAISDNGEIGYRELDYKVKKKEVIGH